MGRGHKTTKAGITECEHDLQEVNSSFYRNTLAARAMGMLRGDFPHTGRERPTPFAFLSLVGRRRICLNRKRHATAFATQYRRPNIEPRVLLLMACLPRHALPPLDSFKLASVGGFITDLWRTRREKNITGIPTGSALVTVEETKAPTIKEKMAGRCLRGCRIRNDKIRVGGHQRYTGRQVNVNVMSDVVRRVRVRRQLRILTATTM